MKLRLVILGLLAICIAGFGFIGCDNDDGDPPPTAGHYADENWDDALAGRGGLMYDKWWVINGGAEPTTDFDPIWSTQLTNTRAGKDTWRCKECHGWDYQGVDGAYGSGSHMTGFAGVWGSGLSRTAIFDAIKDLAGDHDFSGVLTDADVLDVTKFIVDALIDMRDYIDYDTKASLGTAADGEALYTANCMVCHGADGRTINFGDEADPVYVHTVSLDNPWEILHKIRWGHPGSNPSMPSMVAAGLSIDEQNDILAYAQSLGDVVTAGTVRGGALYDKWWLINDGTEPTTDFDPIWGTQSTNTRSGKDTWRCKECHGWDYQGAAGAYNESNSHFTGFTGVWNSGLSQEEVFAAIKDAGGDHDFSGVLSDDDVSDLAEFIMDGLIDMRDYINYDTKASLGDPAAGAVHFNAICILCHGADGQALNFGDEANPVYVADLALDNPWEILHKIRYGHPGSVPTMPSMVEAGLSVNDHSNILAYAQSLPVVTP